MNAEQLTQLLCQLDPMRTGCANDPDMADEYGSQARDIAEQLHAGADARSTVIAVFDEWFWDGCMVEGSRADVLRQIVAALQA